MDGKSGLPGKLFDVYYLNGNIKGDAKTMPTYTYQCKSCKHEFDVLQKLFDSPPKCEECGKKVKRLIRPIAGIHFKGSGFYETDYKNK